MDELCDDEDMEKALIAEGNLQQWVVQPCLPLLGQMEVSSLERHLKLEQYLHPGMYRFVLYIVKEQQDPCFDYDVPREPGLIGLDLPNWTLPSNGKVFRPQEIQLCCGQGEDERLSKLPRKVIVDGEVYFTNHWIMMTKSALFAKWKSTDIWKPWKPASERMFLARMVLFKMIGTPES